MEISLQGYRENVATFEADETVRPGNLVKLTENGKVGLCAEGDLFIGAAVSVRGGCAAVQAAGIAGLPMREHSRLWAGRRCRPRARRP